MDGSWPGSCLLQLQVKIGQVWRKRRSKGTAVGIRLAFTCVVGEADQQGWRETTDLKRSDKAYLTRQGLKNQAREYGHDKVGNKEPLNAPEQ